MKEVLYRCRCRSCGCNCVLSMLFDDKDEAKKVEEMTCPRGTGDATDWEKVQEFTIPEPKIHPIVERLKLSNSMRVIDIGKDNKNE